MQQTGFPKYLLQSVIITKQGVSVHSLKTRGRYSQLQGLGRHGLAATVLLYAEREMWGCKWTLVLQVLPLHCSA